jgi:hypothetical protein
VISGAEKLDNAYQIAQERKRFAESFEGRFRKMAVSLRQRSFRSSPWSHRALNNSPGL